MPSTPSINNPAVVPRRRWGVILLRVVAVLVIGWLVATGTNALEQHTSKLPGPGGFGRGILHGFLMPFAMPRLILGQDVSIYQTPNSGRLYNLGYTLGVNICGLAFFGFFFWRLSRLHRLLRNR